MRYASNSLPSSLGNLGPAVEFLVDGKLLNVDGEEGVPGSQDWFC